MVIGKAGLVSPTFASWHTPPKWLELGLMKLKSFAIILIILPITSFAQEKNWDQILYWGGSPEDQQKAIEVFQESCDKGELRACANLAFAYRSARGVTKDLTKSLVLCKKYCYGG